MIEGDNNEKIRLLKDVFGRDLTEDEYKMIAGSHKETIDAWIRYNNAKIAEMEVVRGLCRENGFIAKDLEGLKSESGLPFIKQKKTAAIHYKSAVSGKGENAEKAYFCGVDLDSDKLLRHVFSQLNVSESGCGWVKGVPQENEEYDMTSHCGGLKYIHYHCNVCGEKVGTKDCFGARKFFSG